MKDVRKNLWHNGKSGCVTFSYDDGRIEDQRLVPIFNRYGVKGTFHLCCPEFLGCFDFLDGVSIVDPASYRYVYEGHEISCHSKHHPFLCELPDGEVRREIRENKEFLEELCGYRVCGMSYPFGSYDDRVEALCRAEGMEYSRTVADTDGFDLPENFMTWHPTCHHANADSALAKRFLDSRQELKLLYVWGHSYEFCDEEKWQRMEDFLEAISRKEDVWYATNIEIVRYLTALEKLAVGKDGRTLSNPTEVDLWVTVDGEAVVIPSGESIRVCGQ